MPTPDGVKVVVTFSKPTKTEPVPRNVVHVNFNVSAAPNGVDPEVSYVIEEQRTVRTGDTYLKESWLDMAIRDKIAMRNAVQII